MEGDPMLQAADKLAWQWVKEWVRAGFIRPGCVERLQASLRDRLISKGPTAPAGDSGAAVESAAAATASAVANAEWEPPDFGVEPSSCGVWQGVIPSCEGSEE